MLKRSTGLLFVLVANILLVTHSILPHHHYGGFAWIQANHYEDQKDPAGIHTEDAEQKHEDHDNDQTCLLKQVYLVPVNSSKLDCPLIDNSSQNLDFQLVYIIQDTSGYLHVFNKIPVPPLIVIGRYSLHVTCCVGLRAPPAL